MSSHPLSDIQQQILSLKQERDVCILAHSYQAREILEIADFSGDSYQLSVFAQSVKAQTILLCGVRFMAETVKILSPQKTVYLSNTIAGCPMAEQMDREMISYFKQKHPECTVVAYINTTADLKTICDVCVTSSSAVKIIRNIKNDNILFIPDQNLGRYVADQIPEKQFHFLQGCCPVHAVVQEREAIQAKQRHPQAELLVHPECTPEVVKHADYVGSTSGIMHYAKNSSSKEFIIGTEMSIAEHLQYECPDKRFYILSKKILCPNMKCTTLMDVYHMLLDGGSAEEIVLPDDIISKARVCIDRMIELGG